MQNVGKGAWAKSRIELSVASDSNAASATALSAFDANSDANFGWHGDLPLNAWATAWILRLQPLKRVLKSIFGILNAWERFGGLWLSIPVLMRIWTGVENSV